MAITLVLGGAASGKSEYAEHLAAESGGRVTYLATADAGDAEMRKKIEVHRSRRPDDWRLWEGKPEELPDFISSASGTMLLDCMTMLITRVLLSGGGEDGSAEEWSARVAEAESLVEKICTAPDKDAELIIVSNETGMGVVPPYPLGRRFRDAQGHMNRLCASYAQRVAFVVAGCPLWIKGAAPGS
jgi:adenosylcobinamide kinase/adenosylcobinamide-phosphate guanylyltransferase